MKKQLITLGAIGLMAASASAQTVVSGDINANTQWTTAGNPYILDGLVFVTNNATLDIAPGVIIRGQPKTGAGALDPGALIVTRDGKIQIRGTATTPVIFTTAAIDSGLAGGGASSGEYLDGNGDLVADKWTPANGVGQFLDSAPTTTPLRPISPSGKRNSSLWGGLIVAGYAPTNTLVDVSVPADGIKEAGQAFMEGLTNQAKGIYGGTDVLDDSGIIKYVSIRHGGYEIAATREINGLTLYGVGRGTTISNVDVYCNSDDGVEIFGGTVDLKYINVNFAEDDGFDVDQGWQGTAQYVYVAHGTVVDGVATVSSSDPRGMELDGDDAPNVAPDGISSAINPFPNGKIYNATVQVAGLRGVVMRNGFGGQLVNSIVQNSAGTETGLFVDAATTAPSSSGQTRYSNKEIQIRNVTVNGFATASSTWGAFNPSTNAGFAFDVFFPATNNRTTSADMLNVSYSANGFNPRPGAGPGVPNGLATGSTQDVAYVLAPAAATTYKGAFDGAATTLWTTGWTAANKTNTAGVKVLAD